MWHNDSSFLGNMEGIRSLKGPSQIGGVTVSTGMLAARRHVGVHTPEIACKKRIANQQMAYAA
jgi:hypothetical protein